MKRLIEAVTTTICSVVALLLDVSYAHASGFSLYNESSAVAIGNYAAGIAAEGFDASIGWYNPAGLVLLSQQELVLSGVGVLPSSKITGNSLYVTPVGLPPALSSYRQAFSDLEGGKNGLVPALHYALPLNDRVVLGLSIVSPFGLSTNWAEDGPVRYSATQTELLTTTISPELGAKVNEHFSLGLGIDAQYAKVKFNNVLGIPTLAHALGLPFDYFDSTSYNKGDSYSLGFHVGALFTAKHTRLGLNYESPIRHAFHGYSRLTGRLATPDLTLSPPNPAEIAKANPNNQFYSGDLSSNSIQLPGVLTLSGYQDINDRVAMVGSIVYTTWSSLKTIQLNHVAAFSSTVGPVPANTALPQGFRDTWRFAIGANIKLDEQWMLRLGGGYDETPVNNRDRSIRLADANRYGLSVGGHYQAFYNLGIDVGYTHLFSTGDVPLDNTFATPAFQYTVKGKAKARADLVGLQVVWEIDKPKLT